MRMDRRQLPFALWPILLRNRNGNAPASRLAFIDSRCSALRLDVEASAISTARRFCDGSSEGRKKEDERSGGSSMKQRSEDVEDAGFGQ